MGVNKRRFLKNKVSCSCSMPGVWKAVSHNDGCVVIYHAPKACAHITGEMELNRHYRTMVRSEYEHSRYTAPLITTGIGRNESIFGGTELLQECLDHVIKTYAPRYVVVTSSCVVGVIGDDTEAVCAEVEERCAIPIIHVDCHGFLDGEYYGGYVEAGKKLIDRFMTKSPKKSDTVVVIGEKDGPRSLAFQDFGKLLATFGIETFNRFPGYCSIEEMADVASSSFSLILGGTKKSYEGLRDLADYMTEKLDIPHFEADYPVGWQATCTWVEKLGHYLHRSEQVEGVKKELFRTFMEGYAPYKELLQQQEIVFCLGKGFSEFDPSWMAEWLHLGGLKLTRVIILNEMEEKEQEEQKKKIRAFYPHVPFEEEDENTRLSPHELILTTHELSEPSARQLLMPMLPPVGPSGLVQMYKKLFMLARRNEERGVVLYGW